MNTGFGEEIINPDIGCYLAGYGFYLKRYAERILDDLKVRVIFIKDKKGNKILLCSFDLIGFSIEFSDLLREKITKKFNIPFSNIFISCIHTHSGPATLNLRGMGKIDKNYMRFLEKKLFSATEKAILDCKESEIFFKIEEIEPIGFNRVKRALEPVDLNLGIMIFKREKEKIYLINYSCHPVTLGINKEISADFVGRIIKEIEKKKNKGIFFQGFCGDIDPFVNKVKWGCGSENDINFYGKNIAQRIFKIERNLEKLKDEEIKCIEKRIKLPLDIMNENEIKQEMERFIERYKDNNMAVKFISNWYEETTKKLKVFFKNPFLENVPIWVCKIGKIKIIGYPGEVFCKIGLKLRKKYSNLLLFGYGNGNIGYIPTKEAYKNRNDYACYTAPEIYNSFPFKSDIENLFIKETEKIVKKMGG